MTSPAIPDPLWSADKIADYFGVSKETVIRWIKDEEMDGGKINNRWKVKQSAVYKYRDEKFAEGAKNG